MLHRFSNFLLFGILCVFMTHCQDPSIVGNGLLAEDQLNLAFDDDFDIAGRTQTGQRLITYTRNSTNSTYMVGSYTEPIFGHTTAEVGFVIGRNPNEAAPKFEDVMLDSMVLILTYDTTGFYGNNSATHRLAVHRITEPINKMDTIYSDFEATYDPQPVGEVSFVPRPRDSITIIQHADTTSRKVPAQIRIRLNDDFAREIINDTTALKSEDAFVEKLKGLYLKSIPSEGSLLGINLGDAANGSSGLNRVTVFYTDRDNSKRNYTFRITTVRYNHFKQAYDNAVVSQFLSLPSLGDSLLFIQGHRGLDTELTISNLQKLQGKIINHAEIIMTIAVLPQDNLFFFPPINQVVASRLNGNNLSVIRDISDLISINGNLAQGFGGTWNRTNNTYRFNVTKRIKEMIENPNEAQNLIISPITRSTRPNRSVIYGPKNSVAPVRLRVTYTDL